MAVIDPSAMFRAGYASKSEGRNPAAEQHNKTWNSVLSFMGEFAIEEIKEGIALTNAYKKKTDSILGPLLHESTGLNADQIQTVKNLKKTYDKQARCATYALSGKKRRGCREGMQMTMAGLTKMGNDFGVIDVFQADQKPIANRVVNRATTDKSKANATLNPGNTIIQDNNRMAAANNELKNRLVFNDKTHKTMIKTGGAYQEDPKTGKLVYGDKKINVDYWQDPKTGLFWKGENPNPKATITMDQSLIPLENLEKGEVNSYLVSNQMRKTKDDLIKMSKDDEYHAQWDTHKKQLESEVGAFLNSGEVDEWAFKAFYFGGFKYNHAEGRMTESAPAYRRMVEEDIKREVAWADENGVVKWKEGYEPGSATWIARREFLKREDFRPGSKFRNEVEPALVELLINDYENARADWEINRPAKPKSGKSGSGKKGTRYQTGDDEHISRANEIDNLVKGKITLQGVKDLTLDLGPKVGIFETDDGKIEILDSRDNIMALIDPSKPEEARSILYTLAQVDSRFKSKGKIETPYEGPLSRDYKYNINPTLDLKTQQEKKGKKKKSTEKKTSKKQVDIYKFLSPPGSK